MTEDKCSTGRILLIVVFAIAASIDAFGVFAAMQQRPASRPATGKPAEQAKFKAIWEPVNVPEDVELFSVHFVNAETGWVAGGKTSHAGGVIYRTTDGGNKWELQVGDPESSDRGFRDLRFVDATHGFAVQGSAGTFHKLYSTSDGQSWAPTGQRTRAPLRLCLHLTHYRLYSGLGTKHSANNGRWQNLEKRLLLQDQDPDRGSHSRC